jgi:hypothetical protein
VVAEYLRDKITYPLRIDVVMFNGQWGAEWLRDKVTYHLGIDMVMFNGQWWQNTSEMKSHTHWQLTWWCSMVSGGQIAQG